MCDRLKINVIKFLAINIVSLFERIFKPQVEQLPQHLWHDIENFIKNEASNKYCWQDFVELDNLPNSVENFGGYSDLPTEEEWEEIFSWLNELYHSNEDVEANKALLQRTKEIKNWCRKLIKKIRNRKSTNTSEGKQITIKSESKIQQKKSEDDIFISDDDLDNDSDDILSNSSSDEENEEEKLEDKYEYYLKFYDHIQQFISEVIGDDIFQDYITGRKNSSENPFVFEVYQSSNARKILKKKKAKKPSVKETRKVSDATTKVSEKAKEIPIQETTKEQKLEMKAKIKELLPKDPPKPTISLEDPEYIYVEINGEYKYVKQEAEFKSKYKNSKAKDKKKRG